VFQVPHPNRQWKSLPQIFQIFWGVGPYLSYPSCHTARHENEIRAQFRADNSVSVWCLPFTVRSPPWEIISVQSASESARKWQNRRNALDCSHDQSYSRIQFQRQKCWPERRMSVRRLVDPPS
jgi:hypothetical protein